MTSKKSGSQLKIENLNKLREEFLNTMNTEATQTTNLLKRSQKALRENDSINLFEENGNELNLSLSGPECHILIRALMNAENLLVAEYFIKKEKGGGENKKIWPTVAELLYLKKSGERQSLYDGSITHSYITYLYDGLSANDAAKKVNEKFNFPSQSACNKWISRDIKKNENIYTYIYGNISKPSNDPIEKRKDI